MNFSVLMSIYFKEKPNNFDKAIKSIWINQTVKPTEIILVEDGILNQELYNSINHWKDIIGESLRIVKINDNVGLGKALNLGIKHCSYDLVARMDTDDISYPDRFKKQLDVFDKMNIDLCSGFISEFDENEENIISFRKVPEFHNEIVNYSKMRNPINHVSVMFKKSSVLEAGNYQDMLWMEDYYLWIRMIINHSKLYNLQLPLVNVRAGKNILSRRRGLKYIKAEYNFLTRLYNIKYLSTFEYLKNLILKIPLRVFPSFLLKLVYKLLREER